MQFEAAGLVAGGATTGANAAASTWAASTWAASTCAAASFGVWPAGWSLAGANEKYKAVAAQTAAIGKATNLDMDTHALDHRKLLKLIQKT